MEKEVAVGASGAARMFFVLSKVFGFFAIPSNFVISIGILGLLLWPTRFGRAGRRLVAASLIVLAILGLSPVGNALIVPLEQRFPPWNAAGGPPAGIVVLGGALSPACVGGAQRGRAQRGGRAADRRRRVGAALSRCPHPVHRRQRRADLRGGRRSRICHARVRGLRHSARARPARRSFAQYSRERCFFQGSRAAEARRALAAGHLRLPHAAGDRHLPQGGLCRSSPIQSIGARAEPRTLCARFRP